MSRRTPIHLLALAAAIGCGGICPTSALAHETDQFTLPADRDDFADLGPDFNRWYTEALSAAVARLNADVDEAIARHAPEQEIVDHASIDSVVGAVDAACLRGNDIVDALERELAGPDLARRHPAGRVCYREADANMYQHAFWICDPRILSRYWFGSTVKVYGHLVGTDKFGHFTAIGVSYYFRYAAAVGAGQTTDEATATAVRFGTTGRMSEDQLMGLTLTGDYSNGDLAANYAGLLLFRNLTAPVAVAGIVRPPLLVRDGRHWRLAPHVRPDSDWLRPFISDHWNEALNPGWFDPPLRPALRDAVRARAERVRRFYAEPGSLDTPDDFRRRRHELATCWGVDYGHRGSDDELVAIDTACFRPDAYGIAGR